MVRINDYLIGVKKGQALNLLCAKDDTFLDRFLKSEQETIDTLDKTTLALLRNELLSKIEEIVSKDPALSQYVDMAIKKQYMEK